MSSGAGLTADVYATVTRRLDVMESTPRRRDGLRSAVREDGLVLNNRGARTYALLGPEDAWLWERMDGSRTVGDLLMAYFQEFRSLAPARVLSLVAVLKSRRMLQDDPVDVWALLESRLHPKTGWWRVALGIISGRAAYRWSGADAAFGRLYRILGGVIYATPVRLLALVLAVAGAAAFAFELVSGRYLSAPVEAPIWGVVLAVYAIQIAILATHELAHGLECKHRGCRVNGFGITFFYAIPCLFVDTTDVWMADRRGRIATSWAGPYSGFVLSGPLALVALVVGPPWGIALFQIVFLLNFTAAFNLLPFVEMDGYYMLVDWLRIPMLRARSAAFLRHGLIARRRARQALSRLEVVYVWYGVASLTTGFAFTVWGLWYWLSRMQRLLGPMWEQKILALLSSLVVGAVLLLPLFQHFATASIALGRQARRAHRWFVHRLPSTVSDRRLLLATGIVADDDEALAGEILRAMRRRSYRRGSLVIREGEEATEFFVIREGEAAAIQGPDECERTRLDEGDYFGEQALMENAPQAASLRALTRLDVLVLRKGDFERLVEDHLAIEAAVEGMRTGEEQGASRALLRLAPTQRRELRRHMARSAAAPGQVIFAEGDASDLVHFIEEGRVEMVGEGDRPVILQPGDVFGETALVDDRPRNATARAVTPVTLYSMDKPGFDAYVRAVATRRGGLAWTAGSARTQPWASAGSVGGPCAGSTHRPAPSS